MQRPEAVLASCQKAACDSELLGALLSMLATDDSKANVGMLFTGTDQTRNVSTKICNENLTMTGSPECLGLHDCICSS